MHTSLNHKHITLHKQHTYNTSISRYIDTIILSRISITSIVLLLIYIIGAGHAYAVVSDTNIPSTIRNNCTLTSDGYIESCQGELGSWEKLKNINEFIHTMMSGLEKNANTMQDIVLQTNKISVQLNTSKRELFRTQQLTQENNFFIDYISFILQKYREELQARGVVLGTIDALFKKTYYNTQQEGLVIDTVSLYKGTKVGVYDTDMILTIKIINHDNILYSTVENIYCYAKIADDYLIFPLRNSGTFPALQGKQIYNIVGTLEMGTDNVVTDIPGKKTMRCNLVYFDTDTKEKISNFSKREFTVE